MEPKKEFIELLQSTKRDDVDYLIEDLEDLGFFKAPASTRFHLNEEGGLVVHSLNVCKIALKLRESMLELDDTLREQLPVDSVIVASLLHDVCKADIYKAITKKQKDAFGRWVDEPGYTVDYSKLPVGHGEKSVIVLLRTGFDLTDDEILAIRWHMSSWDLAFQSAEAKSNIDVAKKICPLLSLVQAADNLASNLLERSVE
ncbi:MAG: HD domain-containing protein [Bacteroidales bacterium]|nr:HD domain-containing protein [Bacteroidales bacterium]